MANYVAMSRSNYFQVKDRMRFEQFCNEFELKLIESGDRLGFIVASVEGAIPTITWDEVTEEYIDLDLMGLLAQHLATGQMAVVE